MTKEEKVKLTVGCMKHTARLMVLQSHLLDKYKESMPFCSLLARMMCIRNKMIKIQATKTT